MAYQKKKRDKHPVGKDIFDVLVHFVYLTQTVRRCLMLKEENTLVVMKSKAAYILAHPTVTCSGSTAQLTTAVCVPCVFCGSSFVFGIWAIVTWLVCLSWCCVYVCVLFQQQGYSFYCVFALSWATWNQEDKSHDINTRSFHSNFMKGFTDESWYQWSADTCEADLFPRSYLPQQRPKSQPLSSSTLLWEVWLIHRLSRSHLHICS